MQFTSTSAQQIRKSVPALLGLLAYISVTSLSAWLALYLQAGAATSSGISRSISKEPVAAHDSAAQARVGREVLASLPPGFEENRGQVAGDMKFFHRAAGYSFFLKANEVVFSLGRVEKAETGRLEGSEESVGCGERIELRSSAFRFASSQHSSAAAKKNRQSHRASPSACSTPAHHLPQLIKQVTRQR